MLRFLPGALLLQLAALVLLWFNLPQTAENADQLLLVPDRLLLLRVLLPCALISLLAAFWFSALAKNSNARALNKMGESHAREREKIQRQVEKDKSRLVEQSQKEIKKQTRRVKTRANFKVGLSLMGMAVAGVIMILTELLMLGMMTLTTAGGALGGYFLRGRGVVKPPRGTVRGESGGAVINSTASQGTGIAAGHDAHPPRVIGHGSSDELADHRDLNDAKVIEHRPAGQPHSVE